MILDLLKKNLSEELYAQVEENLKGKDLGQFIPKTRFDEVNNAKNEAEKKITTYESQLSQFADYEELKTKVAQFGDYEELKKKNDELILSQRKSELIKLGIDENFVDYALGKIDMEKFDESAKEFVEANPKFTAEVFKRIDSSINLNGQGIKDAEKMSDEEYLDFRKTHNIDGTKK